LIPVRRRSLFAWESLFTLRTKRSKRTLLRPDLSRLDTFAIDIHEIVKALVIRIKARWNTRSIRQYVKQLDLFSPISLVPVNLGDSEWAWNLILVGLGEEVRLLMEAWNPPGLASLAGKSLATIQSKLQGHFVFAELNVPESSFQSSHYCLEDKGDYLSPSRGALETVDCQRGI